LYLELAKRENKYHLGPKLDLQHGDVRAVNQAIWAREFKLGPQTSEDLKSLVIDVRSKNGTDPIPLCARCYILTDGVELSEDTAKAMKQQLDSVLNGSWSLDRL
jgi:hypothetical protein